MPKRNLTPDIAESLIKLAAEQGTIVGASEKSGYSRQQIHKWLNGDETFNQAFRAALKRKTAFTYSWQGDWHQSGIKSDIEALVSDYIKNGVQKKKITRKTRKDQNGDIIYTDTVEEIVSEPVPSWVVQLATPRQMPVLEAMNVLLNEGVVTDAQAQIVSDGISEIETRLKDLTPKQLELDLKT